MNIFKVAIATSVALAVCHANAYSIRTHQTLTQLALTRCLGTADAAYPTLPMPTLTTDEKKFLTNLDDGKGNIVGAGIDKTLFESTTISAANLVRTGAVLEDYGIRSVNHFYDPVFDRGFSPLIGPIGYKSPNWALENGGEALLQDYSFHELKRAYAKTLDPSLTPEQREIFKAQVSRISGQVAHHIQDMAQPQHTRNDNHFEHPIFDGTPLEKVNARRSTYEKFVDKLAFDDPSLAILSPCNYPEMTDVFFDADYIKVGVSPRKLWTDNGKGLADYTNRGFVSENTNFNFSVGSGYPSPVLVDANRSVVPATQLCAEAAAYDPCITELVGSVIFYGNTVEDKLFPDQSAYNPRMTSVSVFTDDPDLISSTITNKIFTQNKWTHFEAAKLLVPRAISYSLAVMVDYNDYLINRYGIFEAETILGSYDVRIKNVMDDTISGMFVFPQFAADGSRIDETFQRTLAPGATSDWIRLSGLATNSFFRGDLGEAQGRDGVFGIFGTGDLKFIGTRLHREVSDEADNRWDLPPHCVRIHHSVFWNEFFPAPAGCYSAVPTGYDARVALVLYPFGAVSTSYSPVGGKIRIYADGEIVDELQIPNFASIVSLGGDYGFKVFQLAPGVLAAARDAYVDYTGQPHKWEMRLLFWDPVRRAKWTCEIVTSCVNYSGLLVYIPDAP